MSVPYERYLAAAYDYPRKPGEGPMAYVRRLAEVVEGQPMGEPLRDMPEAEGWLPYRESE